MNKQSFDEIYMRLAIALATRSHCVKKQVGAVLTQATRVVATGYNGPPEGTYNCDEKWPTQGCARTRTGGCFLSLHAEQNAILFALRKQISLQGSTLYITLAPCLPCARMILSAGIIKVLYQCSYGSFKGLEQEEGVDFLAHFGVAVQHYDPS